MDWNQAAKFIFPWWGLRGLKVLGLAFPPHPLLTGSSLPGTMMSFAALCGDRHSILNIDSGCVPVKDRTPLVLPLGGGELRLTLAVRHLFTLQHLMLWAKVPCTSTVPAMVSTRLVRSVPHLLTERPNGNTSCSEHRALVGYSGGQPTQTEGWWSGLPSWRRGFLSQVLKAFYWLNQLL